MAQERVVVVDDTPDSTSRRRSRGGMGGSKLMFVAMLALLVNACSAMHDCAVDGNQLHGGFAGLAGSPDDGRAAGAALALGHLLCSPGAAHSDEVREASPSPVTQAPPPRSETVDVRGRDLERSTLPEGNGLWLRPSAVLLLMDRERR